MRTRLITTSVAIAAAGALALAGCSSSGSSSGSSGGSTGSPTTTAAGGLGGSSTGSSSSNKTYTIGFQGPLSGDYKQLGINEENAYELAIDQANASGKLPFKLKAEPSDDQGASGTAPAAAAKLLQDPAVVGVVGPAFSGPTDATGKKYAAASLALISPSATEQTLTTSGYTTFHRVVPTDAIEGKATADFLAQNKKFKTVFVVDDTSAYGAGVAKVVRAELKKDGVKVDSQSIAPTSDYSALAQKIDSSGDQAMYYGGYDAQAGLVAKALNAVNYKGYEISGNGAKSSVFTSTAKAAGNGYFFACGCLDATTAPQAQAFNNAYKAKFHTPSSTYSPEAYDATNAMIAAITAAAKAGSVTRQTVEQQVGMLDYKGITTTVKFTPSGEVAQATVNLYEQVNGAIKLLGDIKTQK